MGELLIRILLSAFFEQEFRVLSERREGPRALDEPTRKVTEVRALKSRGNENNNIIMVVYYREISQG